MSLGLFIFIAWIKAESRCHFVVTSTLVIWNQIISWFFLKKWIKRMNEHHGRRDRSIAFFPSPSTTHPREYSWVDISAIHPSLEERKAHAPKLQYKDILSSMICVGWDRFQTQLPSDHFLSIVIVSKNGWGWHMSLCSYKPPSVIGISSPLK